MCAYGADWMLKVFYVEISRGADRNYDLNALHTAMRRYIYQHLSNVNGQRTYPFVSSTKGPKNLQRHHYIP
jgi:hypothetical protein